MEVRRVDLANWALQTSSKFTTGVKYQFHQGFEQIRDSEIPITLCPPIYSRGLKFLHVIYGSFDCDLTQGFLDSWKGVWDFQISDLLKTLMELIFNPCGEFW